MKNAGFVISVVLVGLLLLILLSVFGMILGFGGLGMRGSMMYGYGFHPLGLIGPLFWLLLIGGGVWLLVRATAHEGKPSTPSASESPLEILKLRYAKGEINKEQFDAMKKDLEG